MAGSLDVPVPLDDDEALSLAIEAASYVTLNCCAWFDDAPPAIEALAAAGYTLHTASGEESRELHGYLTGMGVRRHFGRLFGPDLVNAFKASAIYYERAFAMAGLHPARCVVVDDSSDPLGWAAQVGALTVLVDRDGSKRRGFDGISISGLDELPALLEGLSGHA
jgi:putative hydrolase of the HAD superfamily